MTDKKPETEMDRLKKKCLKKDGTPRADANAHDLVRLKQLQDGEPLSQQALDEAKKREEERKQKDIDAFKARKEQEKVAEQTGQSIPEPDPALDKPQPQQDHPRITKLKEALMPFTQLEAHESRPDEFILVVRGGTITAGDVRRARRAMAI